MKSHAYISILIVFLMVCSAPQLSIGQENPLFDEFLELFPGKVINAELLEKVLKIEGPFDEHRLAFEKRVAGRIVRKTDSHYLLSVRFTCPAGGYCESVDWYSFNKDGDLISQIKYSKSYGDCAFLSAIDPVHFKDNVFQLISTELDYSCDLDTTYSKELESKIYNITNSGIIKLVSKQRIDSRRKYHMISAENLQESYLAKRSKEELATMRNELFASYGYRFKSSKWQSYFSEEEWYQAFRNEVPESDLSPVEYSNLKLIQRFEKKLN